MSKFNNKKKFLNKNQAYRHAPKNKQNKNKENAEHRENNSINVETSEKLESLEQEVKNLQQQLEGQKELLNQEKDKHVRLYADFENFRKRKERETGELMKTANQRVVLEMIAVLDDFERVFKNLGDQKSEKNGITEGIRLVYEKFKKILEKEGLKKMELAQYTTFDSEVHEAIVQHPIEDQSKKGLIIDVIEPGYTLNEKIIRFAKVIIGV